MEIPKFVPELGISAKDASGHPEWEKARAERDAYIKNLDAWKKEQSRINALQRKLGPMQSMDLEEKHHAEREAAGKALRAQKSIPALEAQLKARGIDPHGPGAI